MKASPKISIIIPLYVITDRFFTDLQKFTELNYENYEILIVCDKKVDISVPKTKLILTGNKKTGPAEKRDLGLEYAKGEICAFIDDDAYPDSDWLKNAIGYFQDIRIAAIGGPGLTPPEDNFWEQITGLVYRSYFCGGPTQHRFVKAKKEFVTDYPAYNLLVKTSILKKIGGYGSYFYGGEDTFLCLKIIKAGYKILYDPEVVVYHHRRSLFFGYLKQIANVGMHRGYFAKHFPETSRQIGYFIPSVLFVGFWSGIIISIYSPAIRLIYTLIIVSLFILGILSVIRKTNLINSVLVSISIFLTHMCYGAYFIVGLIKKDLKR